MAAEKYNRRMQKLYLTDTEADKLIENMTRIDV